MNSQNQIRKSLHKSISYILRSRPAQTFSAYDYLDKDCTADARKVKVLFPLGLLLNSLSLVKDLSGLLDSKETHDLERWVAAAFKLLKKEEGEFYSINYWIRGSRYFKELPLPDDLDDTALVIATHILFNEEFDERYFLKMLDLEIDEGGPYRTWYLGEYPKVQPAEYEKALKSWVDVDSAVNAHILYAAKLYGIDLNGCKSFVEKCLHEGVINSPYYLSGLLTLYYAAKYSSLIKGEDYKRFKTVILSNLTNFKYPRLNPLDKIIFNLIQLYLNEKVSNKRIEELLGLLQDDGAMPIYPLFNNFKYKDSDTYIGSHYVTTSYFIEMLSLYLRNHERKTPMLEPSQSNAELIVDVAISDSLPDESRLMIDKNRDIFVDIPEMLARSIKPRLTEMEKGLLGDFVSALTFFSTAYTFLDYLLDGELPPDRAFDMAVLLKKGAQSLEKLKDVGKGSLYKNAYEALELTDQHYKNFKKGQKLKDPSYRYIVERMSGYIKFISMIPILLDTNKNDMSYIEKFFNSFFIIKQLNDDAHDWVEDLKNDRYTFVTASLLKRYNGKNIEKQRRVYWKDITPMIIDACDKEMKNALDATQMLSFDESMLVGVLRKAYQPIEDLKSERIKVEKIADYFTSQLQTAG